MQIAVNIVDILKMARGDVESRNTRKKKYKENKKHPYKKGGKFRTKEKDKK